MPIVLPIDKNSLWFVNISLSLWITYTWCNASDVAVPTCTVAFKPENKLLLRVAIVLVPDCSSNLLSTSCVLSLPSSWPDAVNLYVPIPAGVDPNPTILDLTRIGFGSLLVILKDKIPLESEAPNEPMKFELCVPWLVSKNACDINVSLPSWPSNVST